MDEPTPAGAVWHLLHLVSLDKPPQGKPCNGCGLCCIAEVCDLGKELGDEERCRALISLGTGRFACGLVADPCGFCRRSGWRLGKRSTSSPWTPRARRP